MRQVQTIPNFAFSTIGTPYASVLAKECKWKERHKDILVFGSLKRTHWACVHGIIIPIYNATTCLMLDSFILPILRSSNLSYMVTSFLCQFHLSYKIYSTAPADSSPHSHLHTNTRSPQCPPLAPQHPRPSSPKTRLSAL